MIPKSSSDQQEFSAWCVISSFALCGGGKADGHKNTEILHSRRSGYECLVWGTPEGRIWVLTVMRETLQVNNGFASVKDASSPHTHTR